VGGRSPITVDVRLLAATNKNLDAEIAKGSFREDLYYRIKVVHIHMPPLREIREEIPLLARHFLKEYCRENGRGAMEFAPEVVRRLCGADWPGNVRQLRNEVMRLAACARQDLICDEEAWEELPGPIGAVGEPVAAPARAQSLKAAVEELERTMIGDALRATGGNQQQAARVLGLSRQGLINKMKRYALGG
jgi:DNA-binding NtrC family response regulator